MTLNGVMTTDARYLCDSWAACGDTLLLVRYFGILAGTDTRCVRHIDSPRSKCCEAGLDSCTSHYASVPWHSRPPPFDEHRRPFEKIKCLRALASWKCCKVLCAPVVTVKTCVLRVTTKKIPEFAPPLEKKSCGRPWLLLMARTAPKHRQSDQWRH